MFDIVEAGVLGRVVFVGLLRDGPGPVRCVGPVGLDPGDGDSISFAQLHAPVGIAMWRVEVMSRVRLVVRVALLYTWWVAWCQIRERYTASVETLGRGRWQVVVSWHWWRIRPWRLNGGLCGGALLVYPVLWWRIGVWWIGSGP